MKNLDNSLRLYNTRVLKKTRMHVYTKKYVDLVVSPAILSIPKVALIRLTEEDINGYRKDFKEDRFDSHIMRRNIYEPKRKKAKYEEKGTGNATLKLVLSREGETDKFKSKFISSSNNQIVNLPETVNNVIDENPPETTSNEILPDTTTNSGTEIMEVTSKENSRELNKNLTNHLIGTIRVRDPRTMIDSSLLENFNFLFFGKKPNHAVIPVSNLNKVVRGNLSLHEVENLYNKYFSKSVQDSIVVIANILNVIAVSNKHHKARMDESFKNKTEALKLKERCDANKLHTRHKKVLESKLKTHFVAVVSSFLDIEFEPAFQMFFLGILTVLRLLDQPKFKKGSIFKNLVLLLWNSLKNSEFEHPKVFAMFRSKTFRPDCIDLISLIEDSRDSDPGITDRMALFFVSSINSLECFQVVIDAVSSDCNDDLGLLIDNATKQFIVISKFEDPQNFGLSSKTSVTTVNNLGPSEDVVHHWMIANTNVGLQQINLTDESRPQNITIATSEPSTSSQHLNTYYENFSNSLLTRVSPDSVTPKVIAPKLNVVSSSSMTTTSLGQTAAPTILTFKSAIQNLKPISATAIHKTDGNTIFLGNKQYQLVRGPVRAVAQNPGNILIRAQVRHAVDPTIRCFANNCNELATIMCSTCKSVKYCSHSCQRLDWYESHINNCERMLNLKQQPNNVNQG